MGVRIKEIASQDEIEEFLNDLRPSIEKKRQEILRTRTELCPIHGRRSKMIRIEDGYHGIGVFWCPEKKGHEFKMS